MDKTNLRTLEEYEITPEVTAKIRERVRRPAFSPFVIFSDLKTLTDILAGTPISIARVKRNSKQLHGGLWMFTIARTYEKRRQRLVSIAADSSGILAATLRQ